jgi:hypothetical protein
MNTKQIPGGNMAKDRVVVRVFTDATEAEVAQSRLEAAGIESHLHSDDIGHMWPSLEETSGIELAVRPEDAEKAKELLKTK